MAYFRPLISDALKVVRLYDITAVTFISNLNAVIVNNQVMKIYPGNDDLYSSLNVDLLINDGKSIFKVSTFYV